MKRTIAILGAVLTATVLATACESQESAAAPDTYQLPADEGGSAYEGIGVDTERGVFYVSETTGGEIHRGTADNPQAEEWLAGDGADGRTTARGITVDDEGRVYIAGGPNSKDSVRPDLWVYSPEGELLAALRAPGTDVFLNDVAIGPDGAAYFTNSNAPQIFRVADDGNGWAVTEWANAAGVIDRVEGFNLGGIVLTEDESAFVVAQGNTGVLWRFDVASKTPTRIADGLQDADGLVLQDGTLTVVRNFAHKLTTLTLSDDGTSASLDTEQDTDPARVFTTAKVLDGQVLFVDSNFREQPPTGPFEVVTDPTA